MTSGTAGRRSASGRPDQRKGTRPQVLLPGRFRIGRTWRPPPPWIPGRGLLEVLFQGQRAPEPGSQP